MRLEFAIRVSEMEKTKRMVDTERQVRLNASEAFYGNLLMSEMKDGGPSIFLEQVPLLEFFFSFYDALHRDLKGPHSELKLEDFNFTYELSLTRKGEELLISNIRSKNTGVISVNYVKAKKQAERVPVEFLEDVFYLYPQLRFHPMMESHEHRFGVIKGR
jgi:hypothetical protein